MPLIPERPANTSSNISTIRAGSSVTAAVPYEAMYGSFTIMIVRGQNLERTLSCQAALRRKCLATASSITSSFRMGCRF